MPLKPHPTDPDKLVYESRRYMFKDWVGLTDEEIDVIDEATWDEDHKSWGIHDFARAIEAKLKEKNNA